MPFVLGPPWHGLAKGMKGFRGKGRVRLQQALELHPWLFVKNHVLELSQINLAFSETVMDRITRKPGIALLTGKTLFLNRRNDRTVLYESSCRVVIKCGYTQDICSHDTYLIE